MALAAACWDEPYHRPAVPAISHSHRLRSTHLHVERSLLPGSPVFFHFGAAARNPCKDSPYGLRTCVNAGGLKRRGSVQVQHNHRMDGDEQHEQRPRDSQPKGQAKDIALPLRTCALSPEAN
jgi:hypothetical protein